MYYKPETGEIFKTHSEIRSASANVLYPEAIDDEMLGYNGVFPLVSNKPDVQLPQIAEPTQPELIDGAWVQSWATRDATAEEIAEIEARAAEATKATVPAKVTRRQARQALLLDGRLDDVPAAIAALDDGTPEGNQTMRMAQIEWEDSLEFERARPLVIEIAAAIGLDEAALDQLFITAAGL